jgi:hypothetical protein
VTLAKLLATFTTTKKSDCRKDWKTIAEPTLWEVVCCITLYRRSLDLVQLVHNIPLRLSPCQPHAMQPRLGIPLTSPISSLGTRLKSVSWLMLPSMNLAEFLIFLSASAVPDKTFGPSAISLQYSTVAAHKRSTSAPYAGSFFRSCTTVFVRQPVGLRNKDSRAPCPPR